MTSSSPGTARPSSSTRCAARPASGSDRAAAHSRPYPFPPVPDEAPIAAVRARLKRARRCIPPPCRSASTSSAGSPAAGRRGTPFPTRRAGKMDAETARSPQALQHDECRAARPAPRHAAGRRAGRRADRRRRTTRRAASERVLRPQPGGARAGAVQLGGDLLLRSAEAAAGGLANRSDQVGRNFMNHNASAMLADRSALHATTPSTRRPSASTISISTTGKGGPPLGNVQLLGKVSAAILKSKPAPGAGMRCSSAIAAMPSTGI